MRRPPQNSQEVKDRLVAYNQMIEASKKWRDCYKPIWDECMKVYNHKHYWAENRVHDDEKENPRKDTYSVNMIHSAVNAMEAATAISIPQFSVYPKQSGLREQARLRQTVINCAWRDLNFQRPTTAAFKDALIIGHGWVKLHWNYSESQTQKTDDELRSEIHDALESGELVIGSTPLDASEAVKGFSRVKTKVDTDEPALDYVNYEHILVDPYATSMDDARWIAQQTFIPLNEFQNRTKWDPEAREDADQSGETEWGSVRSGSIKSGLSDAEEDCFVEVIEFYDLRYGTFCQFVCGADRFLWPPTAVPAPRDHPFFQIRNIEQGGVFYPMSEPMVSKSQQYAMDKIRTEQIRSLQHFVRQYIAPASLKKQNPDVAAAIEGENQDVILYLDDDQYRSFLEDGGQILWPRPVPSIPPDFYAMGPRVSEDFERSYGLTEAFLGGQQNPYTSATSTGIANAGQQLRASLKTQKLQEFIRDIAEATLDFYAMLSQGETELPTFGREADISARIIEGVQPTGVTPTADDPGFFKFTRSDLGPASGRNRFEIEVSAKPPRTEQQRQRQALDMVNGLVPIAQVLVAAGIQVNWSRIIEHYLEDGFGIHDASEFVSLVQQAVAPGSQSNTLQGDPARAGAGAQAGARPPAQGDPAAILAGVQAGLPG